MLLILVLPAFWLRWIACIAQAGSDGRALTRIVGWNPVPKHHVESVGFHNAFLFLDWQGSSWVLMGPRHQRRLQKKDDYYPCWSYCCIICRCDKSQCHQVPGNSRGRNPRSIVESSGHIGSMVYPVRFKPAPVQLISERSPPLTVVFQIQSDFKKSLVVADLKLISRKLLNEQSKCISM